MNYSHVLNSVGRGARSPRTPLPAGPVSIWEKQPKASNTARESSYRQLQCNLWKSAAYALDRKCAAYV